MMSFGDALNMLSNGLVTYIRCYHWKESNKVRLQIPDKNSKMKLPYLYMSVDDVNYPWMPNFDEMFSLNWEAVKEK
jgi:hypothetical protein